MDRLVLITTVVLAAAACSAGSSSMPADTAPTASEPSASVEPIETATSSPGTGPTPPQRCSEQATETTVKSFIEAYTNGEADLANRFFAGEGTFQWYSEPPDRLGEAAYDRATLDTYLSARHAESDRLELVELTHNGYRASDKTGHFDFAVRRKDGYEAIGKGAIDCLSGGIMVWALGPNPGPTDT